MFAPRLVTEGPCFNFLLYLLLCEFPKGTETCTTVQSIAKSGKREMTNAEATTFVYL